ncbi:MAG: Type prenyl endopeptidase Rce1-like, partial [Chloroflexota bacterium]|nr:Type prenyl endopeptidase Rce1-like [Chloroflexota bacterium]
MVLAPAARRGLARRWGGPAALVAGSAIGVALLVPGLLLRVSGMHAAGDAVPAGALLMWGPAVCLVAGAEEVALRAGLQPLLRRAAGPAVAIVATAAVFGVMHLPLFGPAALPLDLGVGIVLGCL